MKKQIINIITLLITSIVFAQNGFNYKALITDNGNVLNNHSVTFKFTVLENGTTAVYQETQTATTDANGIVAVNVGEGTVVSGNFSTIDWGSNPYFLKVEIDTGSGYQDFGTTEFNYVPYAKYAEKAGNTFSGDFDDLSNVPSGLSDGDDDTHLTEAQVDNYVSNNGYLTQVDNIRGIPVSATTPANGQVLKYNGTQFVPADDDTSGGSGTDGVVNSATFSGSSTKTLTLGRSNGLGNITATFSDNDTHLTDSQISAMGYIKNADDSDADATNEIQNLSVSGNQLSISQGNSVTLPTGATKLDDLSDARSDSNGSSIFIGAGAGTNDDQSDNRNIGIGYQTLQSNTIGEKNITQGYLALKSNTSGNGNIAIGDRALMNNTTGNYNIANGGAALLHNTTGSNNIANGSDALFFNSSGNYNVAIGSEALFSNTSGEKNIANGSDALTNNTTGNYNIGIGNRALLFNTTGNSNVAIGIKALYNNTDRSNLIAVGDSALYHNGTGASASWEAIYNTAIGSKALFSNTTGFSNTANGFNSLYSNTTGNTNTANGDKSLYTNTTGNGNTASGYTSLYTNTTGSYNTANGVNSLYSNTTGDDNTASGVNSLYTNTTGSYNTANGFKSLFSNTTGFSNVAIGTNALFRNTDRSNLVAVGDSALYNNGTNASNFQEATNNTALGSKALYSNTTGFNNTASGTKALYSNTIGYCNTASGSFTLYSNTIGNNNTASGNFALASNITGNNNTAIGFEAGNQVQSGSGNVFIGYNAGYYEHGSNKLYIDNNSTAFPLIYGDFNTDELTINGKLEVTDKITTPGSGNADMKAYAYGFIYYNANIDSAKSSGGFTISHVTTGVYKITLNNVPTNDWNYIVSATAEIGGSGTPVIATTDYVGTSGHQNEFYIKIYNLSGSLVDNSFHFVVYRK